MEADSVDLVLCSPPYENARSYGVGFGLKGQDWVDWSVARYVECVRVSRGLVAWVVEGRTSDFRWTASPALLMADLHRAGVRLRKPPVYHRVGIPGSGGPDWVRNDYEFVICSSKGRLPWSDNTACGKPPKYAPGGSMSHRLKDGTRKHNPGRRADGKTESQTYKPPAKANPGNVIHCAVGGGRIGSMLAHENEAPYPEALAEFFVRSFCPPGGVVLDPFCGSGTTLAVASLHGRKSIGIDVRGSQAELSGRRVAEAIQRGCVLPPGSENV
jgi:site-specific DNA-methyltransferase (adenine-specific)/site-specific DNA-methyltransferase (cytosine-N4-specific)